jgi:hypothetical protein
MSSKMETTQKEIVDNSIPSVISLFNDTVSSAYFKVEWNQRIKNSEDMEQSSRCLFKIPPHDLSTGGEDNIKMDLKIE